MIGLSHSSAIGGGGRRAPTSADHSPHRQSWSSDDPASSNSSIHNSFVSASSVHNSVHNSVASAASSGERRSLWRKLRKQTGRMQTVHSTQSDHHLSMSPRVGASQSAGGYYTSPRHSMSQRSQSATYAQSRPSTASTTASGGAVPSRPTTAATAPPGAWRSSAHALPIVGVTAPPPAAAAAAAAPLSPREQLIQSVTGLERLKLIASLGDEKKPQRPASMQPQRRQPPQPAVPRGSVDVAYGRADAARGSLDVRRAAAASQSMDLARPAVVDHSNPDDISAESIRQVLGAYAGKTEDAKSMPRLRRLMMLPHNARREQHQLPDMLALSRISEDDEQPPTATSDRASLELCRSAMQTPRAADASKRLSENSGSTLCSGDADADGSDHRARPRTVAEGPKAGSPTPKRQSLAPSAHRKAADWGMKLDPIVYRNTFARARLASEQHQHQHQPSVDALSASAPSLPCDSPPRRLRRPSESGGHAPADHSSEVERLRAALRVLQSRNEILSELVVRDPLEAVPESVRIHIRTIELENAWLRKELAKRAAR
ncbi:hypothetical protein H4R18_000597 [Coemansia javaensis]|uniref:Uncharacterized protein n=1 Tax=Coemansia javaensis TaxID=2761396 RepID=A0A9W8HHP4_9FUNG|nr:hypothetical protein H4R18_000597 [Coemansia javaensis]